MLRTFILHRKRLTAGLVALVLLVVGVSGAVAVTGHHKPVHVAFIGMGKRTVQIAFLGDSYTWGYGASIHTKGYAYDVARYEHWTAAIVGIPGSGYARVAPRYDETIAGGIDDVVNAKPKVLVVEVGHNDAQYGFDANQVRINAVNDLTLLHNRLPQTKIIVLGPVWLDATPSAHALAIRDAVHAAQQQIPGSYWIDPISQVWFTGKLSDHTGDDATMINFAVGHPDDLGYAHMATVLEGDLRTLGLGR